MFKNLKSSTSLLDNHHGSLYWIVGVTILCILYGCIYWFTPWVGDDFWFSLGTNGISTGWIKFVKSLHILEDRLLSDPLRLANLLGPFFLALWPKLVFNILSSFFILAILVEMNYLGCMRAGGIRSWLSVALFTVCLPWYDYFFTIMFSLNYVWTMAICLAAMLLLFYADKVSCGWHMYIGMAICFSAGWMHEGFGMPLAAGAVALGWLRWRQNRLSKSYTLYTVALCIGAMMILFSPALWHRIDMDWKPGEYPLSELVLQMGPGFAMTILMLAVLLPVVCDNKRRERMFATCGCDRFLLLGVFLTFSCVVVLKFFNGPRTACGVILADIILLMLALKGYSIKAKRMKMFAPVLKFIIFILLFCHLGYAALAQSKFLQENNEIVSLYQSSSNGTIYFNMTYPKFDASLFKTTVRQFNERIPKKCLLHIT